MNAIVEFRGLTKTFGEIHAVENLTFDVQPGRITGFLGPNGSGKSTSLRCLTGLITPTKGKALIDGQFYADLERPITRVGAALEATGFHPGRSGFDNLAVVALAAGISKSRVHECIEAVGMTPATKQRVGTYSLGMKQRLALAGALLGDPDILVLDEPANGLDPEGIAWMRAFLRHRADAGGTVLISSHVLSEVQQTVDDVVIIRSGRLVRACSLEELVASANAHVEIVTPNVERMYEALSQGIEGAMPTRLHTRNHEVIEVEGLPIAAIGRVALHNNIELHGLTERATDLEEVFLELTGESS